jgi:hypothetical protein
MRLSAGAPHPQGATWNGRGTNDDDERAKKQRAKSGRQYA